MPRGQKLTPDGQEQILQRLLDAAARLGARPGEAVNLSRLAEDLSQPRATIHALVGRWRRAGRWPYQSVSRLPRPDRVNLAYPTVAPVRRPRSQAVAIPPSAAVLDQWRRRFAPGAYETMVGSLSSPSPVDSREARLVCRRLLREARRSRKAISACEAAQPLGGPSPSSCTAPAEIWRTPS
jgi:hypothetical protein